MMAGRQTSFASGNPVGRPGAVYRPPGLLSSANRLREVETWIANDLAAVEVEMAALMSGDSIARLSARHQIALRGKLLRPACVVLAAKLGSGFGTEARHLAVAVELIHNATLLHDDVIDMGDRRRGLPAARVIYGNAASVLAGDCLLVEALRRIQRSGWPGLLEAALETIDKMIVAQALELEHRGRLDLQRPDYFRVIEGKTAALFQWAMLAGATVGRLPPDQRADLERYGRHLGTAFQLVDDLLDVSGDPSVMGKADFTDLSDGKMTYPLHLVLERDAALRREVEGFVDLRGDAPLPGSLRTRLKQGLVRTGSIDDCRALARKCADEAMTCLAPLPDGPYRDALATLAEVSVDRAG